MKRVGFLIGKIGDIDNLRLAFWKARKGKSNSSLVEQYRQNLDKNLIKLRQQILSDDVEVGHYRHFFTLRKALSFPKRHTRKGVSS